MAFYDCVRTTLYFIKNTLLRGYFPRITLPTRISPPSATLIDNKLKDIHNKLLTNNMSLRELRTIF